MGIFTSDPGNDDYDETRPESRVRKVMRREGKKARDQEEKIREQKRTLFWGRNAKYKDER